MKCIYYGMIVVFTAILCALIGLIIGSAIFTPKGEAIGNGLAEGGGLGPAARWAIGMGAAGLLGSAVIVLDLEKRNKSEHAGELCVGLLIGIFILAVIATGVGL